jgi:hypothetical protein
MGLSKESWAIRRGLGEFLKELAFVDRRWIRIDSCSNNTFNKPDTGGETKEVDCPLESFCDLLGISANKANEYLCAAKLMESHKRHKTLCPNKRNWDDLKSEFGLDIELGQTSDIHYLGKKIFVIRIGGLCDNRFSAKEQAKKFFKTGWKPKRLRASQANDFLSKTSLDLTIFMAKQRKELDEKEREERKKEGDYDGDDESEDGESFPLATSDDKSEHNESISYTSPAKSKSIIEFDMKDAQAKPIRWTSPNGSTQTAVRIPCTGTRSSFRRTARQTRWIEQVTESMLNKEKVLPEVGVEWLIEALFERHRPQFESFCERKGYAKGSRLAKMANNPDLKVIKEQVRAERKRKRCEADGTEEGEIRVSGQKFGR